MSKHLAICINNETGRFGFVISCATWDQCEKAAEMHADRVGYVGCESFSEAVDKALQMERAEYPKPDLTTYRRVAGRKGKSLLPC